MLVLLLLLLLLIPSLRTLPPLYEDIMVWAYQLSMVEEDPRCPFRAIFDVPQTSWLASSHERS
jgi:hypothetical protein